MTGTVPETAQTGEVVRFRIEGHEREHAGIYFPDDSFVQVEPHEEGPGFDLTWTTRQAASTVVRTVLGVINSPLYFGGMDIDNSGSVDSVWADGPEIMQRIATAKVADVQKVQLHTARAGIHWARYASEYTYTKTTPTYLARVVVLGGAAEEKPSFARDPKPGEPTVMRDILLKCLAKTATVPVRESKETAINGFAVNIPLLRAA